MFIDKSINQKALLNFVKKYKEIGYLQQFAVVHNGDVKIKFAVEPYKEEDIKQLFSLSKTFTSMAIGRAVDEGRLKLDEKVIDIFPFFAPQNPSEYMKQMTVFNLLTMNTGHESCVMPKICMGGNPIKNFMELDIPYEPGTHFAYNSGASLILSAIINVRCGMSLDKYLEPLYEALNIENHYYEEIDGISLGAAGLHVNIDSLIRFGKFLSNEGMVDGKQVISKEYVKLATSKCVDSDPKATVDWTKGYGLHLWMGNEGYRCDGAYGQVLMVLPEKNIIIACQSEVNGMQAQVDLIYELINNLYSDDVVLNLEDEINNVYKIEKSKDITFDKLKFELEDNYFNFNELLIEKRNDKVKVTLFGKENIIIEAGNGYHIKNSFYATGLKRKLSDMMPAFYEETIASCYYKYEDDVLEIFMKNHNTPLTQSLVINLKNDLRMIINNKVIKFK